MFCLRNIPLLTELDTVYDGQTINISLLKELSLSCVDSRYLFKAIEAMPAKGMASITDAPGKTRTFGLLIRSQTLYPTELRVQGFHLLCGAQN
jgi:hypothetical protein